jgi:hypothetical protein
VGRETQRETETGREARTMMTGDLLSDLVRAQGL